MKFSTHMNSWAYTHELIRNTVSTPIALQWLNLFSSIFNATSVRCIYRMSRPTLTPLPSSQPSRLSKLDKFGHFSHFVYISVYHCDYLFSCTGTCKGGRLSVSSCSICVHLVFVLGISLSLNVPPFLSATKPDILFREHAVCGDKHTQRCKIFGRILMSTKPNPLNVRPQPCVVNVHPFHCLRYRPHNTAHSSLLLPQCGQNTPSFTVVIGVCTLHENR